MRSYAYKIYIRYDSLKENKKKKQTLSNENQVTFEIISWPIYFITTANT
jgi:hypothetical protein